MYLDHVRAGLAGDVAALNDVLDGLVAHRKRGMAQRAELVVLVLEGVGVDAADLDTAFSGKRAERGKILDAVPRNV